MATEKITVTKLAPNIYAETGIEITGHVTSHYSQLVGKTVKQIVFEKFEGSNRVIVPVLHFTDGTMAYVMQDPEGNGPGHLDICTP